MVRQILNGVYKEATHNEWWWRFDCITQQKAKQRNRMNRMNNREQLISFRNVTEKFVYIQRERKEKVVLKRTVSRVRARENCSIQFQQCLPPTRLSIFIWNIHREYHGKYMYIYMFIFSFCITLYNNPVSKKFFVVGIL